MADRSIFELGAAQCLEYLGRGGLGRVGLSVGALPAIFPVQFALAGHDVVFRAGRGSLLTTSAIDSVVAFQTDAFEDPSRAWSVLVIGCAGLVGDQGQLEEARRLVEPWRSDAEDEIMRIPTDVVSGRVMVRFRPTDASFGTR